MQIFRTIRFILTIAALALPAAAYGQSSSINTFSPYTFYGLGDIASQGPAYIRSMGGAGIAYREPGAINYLNPAAMSSMLRNTFIMNVGAEGANYYLKNSSTKTSYNTFNIRDIAIQFPLGKGIAFGVSVTPFSSVGYRISQRETDPNIIANIGDVRYHYTGEGDLTQMKGGVGWLIGNTGLSIGAELIYYVGNIRRKIDVETSSITGGGHYADATVTQDLHVSHINGNFGFQYSPKLKDSRKMITIGAAYQPKVNLKPEHRKKFTGGYGFRQIEYMLSDEDLDKEFTLPQMLTVGFFFHNPKLSVGFDYQFQEWGKQNKASETDNVTFRNTSTFKAGLTYVPRRDDSRRYMRRVSYRFGLRYGDYYMNFYDKKIDEKAVTLGFGFPVSTWALSKVNVGFEYGRRGTTKNNLIRENYFKFSVGLSLFGTDDWFKKYRYE